MTVTTSQMAVIAADVTHACTASWFLGQTSGQNLALWENLQVPHWDSIAVSCIGPARWGNGDQGMTEIHKCVNAAPLRQSVVV